VKKNSNFEEIFPPDFLAVSSEKCQPIYLYKFFNFERKNFEFRADIHMSKELYNMF